MASLQRSADSQPSEAAFVLDDSIKRIISQISESIADRSDTTRSTILGHINELARVIQEKKLALTFSSDASDSDIKNQVHNELKSLLSRDEIARDRALSLRIISALTGGIKDMLQLEKIRHSLSVPELIRNMPLSASPTRPLRILSLDGGGMRGLFSLAILRYLATEFFGGTGKEETQKLLDCFDILAGTSTGSIIVAGLVTGSSLDEIRETYLSVGTTVFDWSFYSYPLKIFSYFYSGDFYSGANLEALFKARFGEKKLREVEKKCFMTSTNTVSSPWSAFLLRSYPNLHSPTNGTSEVTLAQALRATSAAPTYFAPVLIDEQCRLVDGGCVANNPTEYAMFEASDIFGNEKDSGVPSLILSIGTGIPPPRAGSVNTLKLLNEFIDICTTSEATHLRVSQCCSNYLPSTTYIRLSPPGLGGVPLDCPNHQTLKNGEEATMTWLKDESQSKMLEKLKSSLGLTTTDYSDPQ